MSYIYAEDDLISQPQTYQYTEYQAEALVEAWIISRNEALTKLPSPALYPAHDYKTGTTSHRLQGICQNLRIKSQLSDSHQYWITVFIKKFEVSKRLHYQYNDTKPHKAFVQDDFNDLTPYLLLTEALIHKQMNQSKSYLLSCILKLCDTLCTQIAKLNEEQSACLAWLITQEQALARKVMRELQL